MPSARKPHTTARPDSAKAHVRGSALLLCGRVLSLGLNFAAQILTVRYLSKSDYGALAFVLTLVAMGSNLNVFSLSTAIGRFTSIYHARGEPGRILGAILLSLSAVVGFGICAIVAIRGFHGALVTGLVPDPLAASLLLTLVALAPIEALDALLVKLLAAFGGAKLVFLRRHVLGPGLRLAAVASVVLAGAGVRAVAFAHLFAGVVGVAIYASLLFGVFRRQKILTRGTLRRLDIPFREVLSFSLPLLSSDVFFFARTALLVFFVEALHGAESVAELRAVGPVSRLNGIVQTNFAYLFVPMAARLFAQGARATVESMYWKSVGWVAVLSFPIFATTCLMAEPVTVLLFGERYANSGAVLAVLAIGSYAHAIQVFDTDTLKVLGRVRAIVASDLIACGLALAVGFVALPRLGAVGAAITSTTAIVANRVSARLFLRWAGGIGFPRRQVMRIYGGVATSAALLYLLRRQLDVPLPVGLSVTALLTLLLLWINRDLLDVGGTFPELRRLRIFPGGLARGGWEARRGSAVEPTSAPSLRARPRGPSGRAPGASGASACSRPCEEARRSESPRGS